MNYTFVEHIANGGFGRVDKVKGEDGLFYAKKTFQLEQKMVDDGLEDNAKKRFIQEAQFQSTITHQNVVPVIELFIQEDPPYFIMPLAVSSLEKDAKRRIVDASNFMGPVLDILSGLEEIHSIDIYHRDLKPSNVLKFKSAEGAFYHAIGDFGLMSLKQRTGVTVLTSTVMGKQSDMYTAPEIHQHLRNSSAASDIYSLACIIHDFVGTGSRMPLHEIVDRSPYTDILSICTKLDPKRRFQTVSSMRDVLATVDADIITTNTENGVKITGYLNRSPVDLTEDEVEEIASYLKDDTEDVNERKSVLLQLDLAHIEIIKKYSVIKQFATAYCDLIKESSFQWASCDALASRINKLISNEAVGVQTDGLMALLYMGTGHNRWYVERLFAGKIGPNADISLIKRLNMEFVVDDAKICRAFHHLTISINYDYSSMHPVLLGTVKRICNIA
jgi:serine/threonine protein kinase